jgi:hypothetical protein
VFEDVSLSVISPSMAIVGVLFGESEIISFVMIVIFHMTMPLDLSAARSADANCGRFTLTLMPRSSLLI